MKNSTLVKLIGFVFVVGLVTTHTTSARIQARLDNNRVAYNAL